MDPHNVKIGLHNSRKTAHVFCVEPWGEDYTFLPGEEATLVAFSNDAAPWFSLVEQEGGTLVYCEGASSFKVVQGDRELACGHQRQ